MRRFARYEKDFMGVMKSIQDKDIEAVDHGIQEMYARYFLTESLAIDFLTWVFAQHAITLFELLNNMGLTFDQEMQVRKDAPYTVGIV